MSRRALRSIHRTIARKQGINAAAWFAEQSFTSASRGDMPLTRLSDKQANQAGAALLPEADETTEPKRCIYCGGMNEALDDYYCSRICAINAMGDV